MEAAGYRLVLVAIGTPEGGKEFCERLPFPEAMLFLDPGREVYRHVALLEGFKAMFNDTTWKTMRSRKLDEFKPLLAKYKLIKPPDVEATTQLGGAFVLDNGKVVYRHMDAGLGDHAPAGAVLAACCKA